jgi:hypothetical protein
MARKRKRAHKPNGTFNADNPKTPENEAYVPQVAKVVDSSFNDEVLEPKSTATLTVKVGKGQQICDGPTTGYRDGPDGTIETANFKDGWLPGGWHDNPAKCSQSDGEHCEYVKVEL